jgi:hypothetical protein
MIIWVAILLVGCQPGTGRRVAIDDSDTEHIIETVPGSDWPDDGGEEDPGAAIFEWGQLPELRLELSDEAIRFLHQDYLDFDPYSSNPDPFEYVEGSLTYDGLTYEPVGVRLKGQNSARDIDDKAAFKFKFNKYVPDGRFHGLKAVTLNNMVSDPSMVNERIAYWLYGEAGLPASRANHAALFINDEYYGLFALLESVDDQLLKRHFEDPDGSLFEGWDVDFYSWYIPHFQLEEGPNDRTMLAGLASTLEDSGSDAIIAAEKYVNYDAFRRWWAVGAVVAQFDGYPYSDPGDDFHVYADPQTDQLYFLPHGLDECMFWDDHGVQSVNGIVAYRCSQVQSCKNAWVDDVFEVLDLAEQKLDWEQAFLDIQKEIEPYMKADDRKPYSDWEVQQYQNWTYSVIKNRRAEMESQLGAPSK